MPDTPAQMKIFVSHSSTDRAACDAFVGALRGAGANVWYDEHNLGAGQLMDEIQRELHARPVVMVLLSPDALASKWVVRECKWAYTLADQDPSRIILPVVVRAIEPRDLNAAMLFLSDFKRIEGPGNQPYPQAEAISRMLKLLALTPQGQSQVVVAPQPAESLNDLLTQGRALQAQQKHAEALPFFLRATQTDLNSFSAWGNLGYTLNELKRYTEALPVHERATTLDPNNAIAWVNKSWALIALKRYEEGLAACSQALTLDPNNADAWHNKGSALEGQQRYQEALEAYERALTIDQNRAISWRGKGLALTELKRYANGLAACEKALALDPNNALAWNNKGNVLYGLKRYEEALAAYEWATTLDPTSALAWRNKGFPLRALGREAEAAEAERRAQALGG
jgi:tetratricopeptide (TPR) repeat protein